MLLDISNKNLPPQNGLEAHWLSKDNKPITDSGLIPSRIGDDSRVPVSGSCLNLQGVDDFFNTAIITAQSTNTPFSVGSWFFTNSLAAQKQLFVAFLTSNSNTRVNCLVNTNGSVNFQLRTDNSNIIQTTTAPSLITINTWYHLVFIYSGGTTTNDLKIYINSNDTPSTGVTTGTFSTIGTLDVNRFGANAATFSTFQMFDIRGFSNKALTSQEVLDWYNFSNVDGVTWQYKCDEATNVIIYDSSGNNNHTALIGGIPRTTQNQYSFANEEGYTLSGSTRIPKSNTSTTLDVLGNKLTYKGKVSYPAQFVSGNSISFDTTDDYVEFNNPYSFLTTTGSTTDLPVSIFARVLFKENGTTDTILGASENTGVNPLADFVLYRHVTTNKIRFNIYNAIAAVASPNRFSTWQGNFTPSLNTWYDVVLTYNGNRDSNSIQFYVDGVLYANDLYTFSGDGFYTGKTQPLRTTWQISKLANGSFTSKDISILSVYDSVLTAQDVLDLHNNIFNKPSKVFFTCSEGSGLQLYDKSGNGYHGTLIGGVSRTTQNLYPHNQLNKHWQYTSGNTSGQTNIIYSPIDLTGVEPTGYTLSRVVNGSRYEHNGCETKINFNPYSAPRLTNAPTAYVYGSKLLDLDMAARLETNKESNFLFYNREVHEDLLVSNFTKTVPILFVKENFNGVSTGTSSVAITTTLNYIEYTGGGAGIVIYENNNDVIYSGFRASTSSSTGTKNIGVRNINTFLLASIGGNSTISYTRNNATSDVTTVLTNALGAYRGHNIIYELFIRYGYIYTRAFTLDTGLYYKINKIIITNNIYFGGFGLRIDPSSREIRLYGLVKNIIQ
jgi:hypothetical protein